MSESISKPKQTWIGPTDFAKHRGVSLRTVKDWIKEGRLENCFKTGNNGRKKINWELADQALNNSSGDREKDSVSPGESSSGVGTLTKARTAKTAMEAQAAKLKYEQLAGSLVKADEVREVAKKMGRLTKDSLLTLADRLSPILAGKTEVHEIHRVLTEEINTALRNLATENFDFFKEGES